MTNDKRYEIGDNNPNDFYEDLHWVGKEIDQHIRQLTIYDLLETTWSVKDPVFIGEYNGHRIMTHQFVIETEPHIDPLYVSDVNMNTRYIKYTLPEKRIKFPKKHKDYVPTFKEFFDYLKFTGVQLSEPTKENPHVEVLYNQEYFHYAKIKILNDAMDKVIFEAERYISTD